MKSCLGSTPKQVLENVLPHLEAEYEEIDSFLNPEEAETYRRYYADMPIRHLPAKQRLRRDRRFCRGYLRYIVAALLDSETDRPLVLDAGAGLGTQSILFGLLGAEVRGVDLREDRVAIARKRLGYWQQRLKTDADVGFECRSVFSLPLEETYDLIWVCQAISHIDPAEDFLELSYNLLKPGGQIVLHDPNGLYLANQVQQLRNRGLRVHRTYKTHTGETVPYAVERLFTYGGMRRLLRQAGFEIAHAECQLTKLRGVTSDETFERFIRPLDSVPVFSALFGQSFVVAGRKPGD